MGLLQKSNGRRLVHLFHLVSWKEVDVTLKRSLMKGLVLVFYCWLYFCWWLKTTHTCYLIISVDQDSGTTFLGPLLKFSLFYNPGIGWGYGLIKDLNRERFLSKYSWADGRIYLLVFVGLRSRFHAD